MKKLLVLFFLISTFLFGSSTLEKRVETQLRTRNIIQVQNDFKVDFDINIDRSQMKIEIWVDETVRPLSHSEKDNLKSEDLALQIVGVAREIAPNVKDITLKIMYAPLREEDKTLFSKTFN